MPLASHRAARGAMAALGGRATLTRERLAHPATALTLALILPVPHNAVFVNMFSHVVVVARPDLRPTDPREAERTFDFGVCSSPPLCSPPAFLPWFCFLRPQRCTRLIQYSGATGQIRVSCMAYEHFLIHVQVRQGLEHPKSKERMHRVLFSRAPLAEPMARSLRTPRPSWSRTRGGVGGAAVGGAPREPHSGGVLDSGDGAHDSGWSISSALPLPSPSPCRSRDGHARISGHRYGLQGRDAHLDPGAHSDHPLARPLPAPLRACPSRDLHRLGGEVTLRFPRFLYVVKVPHSAASPTQVKKEDLT